MNREMPDSLPVRGNLRMYYVFSVLGALLLASAALGSLRYRELVYPTDNLLEGFVPNDVVSLLVGVPILFFTMWLARRGRLVGLLGWPGALFYMVYNSLAYVLALPLGLLLLVHLFIIVLSVYTLAALVPIIDSGRVTRWLTGAIPERLCGGALALLGLLIFLRVPALFAGALAGGTPVPQIELAVSIADFLTAPAWIIGGVQLWRRRPIGYAVGFGLLFQTVMLFAALIILMVLQPVLTGSAYVAADIVVVAVMGLVCSVPLVLFWRGAARASY